MKKSRLKLWEDAPAQPGDQPTASEPAAKADLDEVFANLMEGLDEAPSEEEMQRLADSLRRDGLVEAADLLEAESAEEN